MSTQESNRMDGQNYYLLMLKQRDRPKGLGMDLQTNHRDVFLPSSTVHSSVIGTSNKMVVGFHFFSSHVMVWDSIILVR